MNRPKRLDGVGMQTLELVDGIVYVTVAFRQNGEHDLLGLAIVLVPFGGGKALEDAVERLAAVVDGLDLSPLIVNAPVDTQF